MVPRRPGFLETQASTTTTSSAGTTVTGSASIHTKGAWAQLFAATSARSLGILIAIENTAASNTNTSTLLDIGQGAAGSEQVIIPDLAAGYTLNENVSNDFRAYYFPLFIPDGVRLSARLQAVTASKTANVRVHLFQRPMGAGMNWFGTRVTAYGVVAASSRGTLATSGTNAYGTAGQLTASTTHPIRFMQLGMQGGSLAALADVRVLADVRIGATTSIAGPLMGSADTGTESVSFNAGNSTLARQSFDLPAGVDLRVASMVNTGTTAYDWIAYGVD